MKSGFSSLGLLVVVALLAALSIIVAVLFNPAEVLRKNRDTQRIADLNAIKTALILFSHSTNTPLCLPQMDHQVYRSYPVLGTIELADLGRTDGHGWLPINLAGLSTGSPLTVIPVDPLNSVDRNYLFMCDAKTQNFELKTKLENQISPYQTGTDPKLLD